MNVLCCRSQNYKFLYRVTFPQLLNLNSFVKESDSIGFVQHANGCSSEHGSIESAIKCDDCSTTDSGSALEEDGTPFTVTGNNNNDGDLQDDDEGIDMSACTSNTTSHASTNESGPYIYELFAIMIHSGSASGGHYYAYIKDFNNGEWFCFNDQTVSSVSFKEKFSCFDRVPRYFYILGHPGRHSAIIWWWVS